MTGMGTRSLCFVIRELFHKVEMFTILQFFIRLRFFDFVRSALSAQNDIKRIFTVYSFG